ncbi:DUF1801 domain-containing protein [Amycolatopsis orientalis]|uniref:DUF1801 domain-containing protein n=1 Tax=Amycolatopsis orientalis TaxID=31958 RepID=UPI0003A37147|nr:DUF1801 domain-containing protein [Amycolatopsis orientalis]
MPKFTTVAEYVAAQPEALSKVYAALLPVLDDAMPAPAALYHGAPTWKADKNPVCLAKAYSSYVTLAFWRGQLLDDGGLEPSAREMAHVKLRSAEDVDAKQITAWARQAFALETESSA